MNTLERARQHAEPAHAYLRQCFGLGAPAVVYLMQRSKDGPVKIGRAESLTQRAVAFLNGSPEPVLFPAVLPGGQPLEAYLQRRFAPLTVFGEWYAPAHEVVAAVGELAALQAKFFADGHGLPGATVEAIRHVDAEVRELERLAANGVQYKEIATMAGVSARDVRDRCANLRAIGFPIGLRGGRAARNQPRIAARTLSCYGTQAGDVRPQPDTHAREPALSSSSGA